MSAFEYFNIKNKELDIAKKKNRLGKGSLFNKY